MNKNYLKQEIDKRLNFFYLGNKLDSIEIPSLFSNEIQFPIVSKEKIIYKDEGEVKELTFSSTKSKP